MAKAMFHEAWEQRIVQAVSMASSVGKQIKDTEKKISDLVAPIMDASNARVITAYGNALKS